MKQFFNEYGGVAIIVIVIAVLLLIVGSIKSLDENSGKVEGSGIAGIVGNNLSDTINSFQEQLIYNDNIGIMSSYNLTNETYKDMPVFDTDCNVLADGMNLDMGHGKIKEIKADSYYTLSFYARCIDAESASLRSYLYPHAVSSGYSNQGQTTSFVDGWIDRKVTQKWTRITITYKTRKNISGERFFIAARRLEHEKARIQIAGVKIEEGQKATRYVSPSK